MADIKINRDSKFVKALAAQARNERLDSNITDEINTITKELAQDNSPAARHQLAQAIAYGVDELQQKEIEFLAPIADIKNIGYGDKALFNTKHGNVHAYFQAKGATTARSFIANKQVAVDTQEISARPAINIMDIRCNRINMGDLVRDANREMTNAKLAKIEDVLQAAISGGTYATPFYGTGTGVVKATLDTQLTYFRRLGPVTILGDIAAITKLNGLVGLAMNNGTNTDAFMQRSNAMLDAINDNGFYGKYNGANVIALQNAYKADSTTTVMDTNWLYIIPGGLTGDARNLKVVNEGGVQAFESQNIDDLVMEIRLDQWFGAAFVVGTLPTIGAYQIA